MMKLLSRTPDAQGPPAAQQEPHAAPEPAPAAGPLSAPEVPGCPWSFTLRAREGMTERGYTLSAVLETLQRPACVYPSRREGAFVATRAGMLVIHDRAGMSVLSVRGEPRA